MTYLTKIHRRTVLAGKAALAGLAIIPGVASARSASDAAITDTAAGATKHAGCASARWHTASAEELAGFVGDRFRVRSAEHGDLVLKLVEVEAVKSGDDRPGDLSRREGVVAVFDSPDMAPLVADGAGTYRVSHPRIGAAELHVQATPRRSGGHHVEIVLN